MDFGVAGRRALVMGGGRGLGRGIAGALAREGARVTIAGRDRASLQAAAQEMNGVGGSTVDIHRCDLGSAEEISDLVRFVGLTDILVNNSGGPPPGPIADVQDEVWLQQFETMFLGCVRLTRALLPGMRQRGWGRIITVVSSGVQQPIPNLGISNAIRLAIVDWSKTLAGEVAADGVTANCIAPGRIHTDRVEALDEAAAGRQGIELEEARRRSRATIPAGRYGTVEEFAAVAAFLASNQASYITGSVHRVDGGMIRAI